MSESAWLVCDTHKVSLGLGKPVRNPDHSVNYFYAGSQNSANSDLTKSLWKFLANHADHQFRIVSSYDDDFEAIAGYRLIGSDSIEDIDFPEYLRGFPG
jgi:hypothetical protein